MKITRAEFYEMTEVLWHELEHQNGLDRVQDKRGARDIPGFMTLADCYVRRVQAWWVSGNTNPALSELRKLTAICVSAMIHCGVCDREKLIEKENLPTLEKIALERRDNYGR